MWLKNNNDKPDAMLTLGIASFILVGFRVLTAAVVSIDIFGKTIQFREMDAMLATGLLAATLGAYCTRRYHEGKRDQREENNSPEPPPSGE